MLLTYAAEKDIADKIQSNNSVAYISAIDTDFSHKILGVFDEPLDKNINEVVQASLKDEDLFYHTSILVSTTWNNNNDVFTPETVWAARHTPVHKPTNLEHDSNKIVGHMTASWAIDTKGNKISDDIKKLPSKFHILVGSVIYKLWPKNDDYSIAVASLLKSIKDGEKYVSMECIYDDFDYAFSDVNDNKKSIKKIVARNEDTAFLSKYLTAYGGDGLFKGEKIGRVLRKIAFSGKGYVDKPANPESVIFYKDEIFDFAKAEIHQKYVISDVEGVTINSKQNLDGEIIMAVELYQEQNKELKEQNAALAKEITELKDKFAKSNVDKLEKELTNTQAKASELVSDVEKKSEVIKAKDAELSEIKAKLDEVTKANEKLTSDYTVVSEKLAKAESDKLIEARISTLVDGGYPKDEATKKVELYASLNEDQFKAISTDILAAHAAKNPAKTDEVIVPKVEASEKDIEDATITDEPVVSAGKKEVSEDITLILANKLAASLKTSDKDGDK